MMETPRRRGTASRSRGCPPRPNALHALAALALALLLSSCATSVRYVSAPRDAADALECGRCRGRGLIRTCPQCDGAGQTVRPMAGLRETGGPLGTPTVGTDRPVQAASCLACGGAGVCPGTAQDGVSRVCDRCKGSGRVYRCDASGKRVPAP